MAREASSSAPGAGARRYVCKVATGSVAQDSLAGRSDVPQTPEIGASNTGTRTGCQQAGRGRIGATLGRLARPGDSYGAGRRIPIRLVAFPAGDQSRRNPFPCRRHFTVWRRGGVPAEPSLRGDRTNLGSLRTRSAEGSATCRLICVGKRAELLQHGHGSCWRRFRPSSAGSTSTVRELARVCASRRSRRRPGNRPRMARPERRTRALRCVDRPRVGAREGVQRVVDAIRDPERDRCDPDEPVESSPSGAISNHVVGQVNRRGARLSPPGIG